MRFFAVPRFPFTRLPFTWLPFTWLPFRVSRSRISRSAFPGVDVRCASVNPGLGCTTPLGLLLHTFQFTVRSLFPYYAAGGYGAAGVGEAQEVEAGGEAFAGDGNGLARQVGEVADRAAEHIGQHEGAV